VRAKGSRAFWKHNWQRLNKVKQIRDLSRFIVMYGYRAKHGIRYLRYVIEPHKLRESLKLKFSVSKKHWNK